MAADILLEIQQIPGEGQDKDHPNTIEVQSYSLGPNQEVTNQKGANLVGGGSSFSPFTIQKLMDKSSIKLFQHLCAGARIDSMKLYSRRPAEAGATPTNNAPIDYLIYQFDAVQVTDMSCDGNSGSAIPNESFSFNYQKLQSHYREIKDGQPQGPVSMSYDLKTNRQA
jgi:type VI secretion system Hcp family effector